MAEGNPTSERSGEFLNLELIVDWIFFGDRQPRYHKSAAEAFGLSFLGSKIMSMSSKWSGFCFVFVYECG